MLCLTFITGTAVAYWRAGTEDLDRGRGFLLAPLVVATALLGARLLYVLVNIRHYVATPIEILDVRAGGLVGYGALLAIPAGVWYVRRLQGPVWHAADVIAPSIALGIFLYRIGCFLSGCCYGAPTSLSWGVLFPQFAFPPYSRQCLLRVLDPNPDAAGVFRHPTQIYESLFGLFAFVTLTFLITRVRRRDGVIFFGLLFAYALWRFLIELVRDDPRGHLVVCFGPGIHRHLAWIDSNLREFISAQPSAFCAWLSTSQVISMVLAAGCAIVITRRLHGEDASEIRWLRRGFGAKKGS